MRLQRLVAFALLCALFPSPGLAADLTGRITAGPGLEPPAALSVAVDGWVCGKDGSTPDPRLVVGEDRGLANVVVSVQGLEQAPPYPPSAERVIDQQACVFEPHVLLVAPGETVTVKNGDTVFHNFRTTSKRNKVINKAQPGGVAVSARFEEPEIIRVECDVHHWMSAVIVVAEHAFTTVTGADGTFSLSGLAQGAHTLMLWHEQLGSRETSVEVSADGGRLDLEWDAVPPATPGQP